MPAPRLAIFRPGRHTALSGTTLEFSEADLAACAAAYDPKLHEAPLVIGHPALSAPAYGWVGKLDYADGLLQAEPRQVAPEFAAAVADGRYKKISASFWQPGAPGNPKPETFYLRHVGFLGGAAPAVKGLPAAQFAADETGVIEFGDWSDTLTSRLLRRLRDWIIGRDGLAAADAALPADDLAALEAEAARPEPQEAAPSAASTIAYAESPTGGDAMSADEKARLAELEAENNRLKAEAKARQDAALAAARERTHAEHVSFCDQLTKQGRLIPGHRDEVLALLDFVGNAEGTLEFAEGRKEAPIEVLRKFIAATPKQVEFREIAGAERDEAGTASFAAPPGYHVDSERLEIHAKAIAWQKAHPNTDYLAAVAAVTA